MAQFKKFIHLIKSAIIIEQSKEKEFVVINDVIEIVDGAKFARFEPYKGFLVDFTIDFPHPAFKLNDSQVSIDFFKDSYIDEISRARTFVGQLKSLKLQFFILVFSNWSRL